MKNTTLNSNKKNSKNIQSKRIYYKLCSTISIKKYGLIIVFLLFISINEFSIRINLNSVNNYNNYTNYRNVIHISMSFEEFYFSPSLISITSVLINAKNDTFINYHFVVDSTINETHQIMIKSLIKFHSLTNFSFYNASNIFKEFTVRRKHMKLPAYFLLGLHLYLLNVHKTIYLDSDTLVYSDLSEMYNLDMNGLYFRGILDEKVSRKEFNSIKADHFINSGVLLMNIDKYREDDIFKKTIEYSKSHIMKQNDQELINAVAYFGIDILPPKYGIPFLDKGLIETLSDSSHQIFYDKNELLEANKNITIRHYWKDKVWRKGKRSRIYNDFIYYAHVSGFYNYICSNLNNTC